MGYEILNLKMEYYSYSAVLTKEVKSLEKITKALKKIPLCFITFLS